MWPPKRETTRANFQEYPEFAFIQSFHRCLIRCHIVVCLSANDPTAPELASHALPQFSSSSRMLVKVYLKAIGSIPPGFTLRDGLRPAKGSEFGGGLLKKVL